ncbi:MAG: hypothetical protein IIZ95_07960, partial [Erysipelotrichaceae bacterium]|nr:hypothetical protein [Erysipelotrichaceae bacterium]
ILALLTIVLLGILIIGNELHHKKADLYIVLLNNDSVINACDPSVFEEALKKAGYSGHADINDRLSLGYENNESADIETLQVLSALFAISDLDVYVAPKEYFDYFAEKDGFADLSLLIDKEILSKVKDDQYHFSGESGNKILAGITLHPDSKIHKAGYYHDDVIIGVVANAVNLDAAIAMIEEILK